MKVVYIADRWDPRDHSQASGTDYEIYQALLREGAEVEIIGPFDYQFSFIERALMKVYGLFSDKRLFKYPFFYFLKTAYYVNQALAEIDYDLVLSLYSAPLVFVRLDKPLLYLCDSSVKWIRNHWQGFSKFVYFSMAAWESRVIKKTDHIITFSEANAKVLNQAYGVPLDSVTSFAIPASVPDQVVPQMIEKTEFSPPVRLLLVGRDYHRKGVDIAIEIVEGLNQLGIQADLRVVGLDGEESAHTKFMGLYDKTIQAELEGYIANYEWAHFLLHPARFEAAGIVPSEAAAFGVPTLTNATGGLATTVEDGVSGRVFPKDSPAKPYIAEIKKFVNQPDAYFALVDSTKERYERELNWPAARKTVFQIAESLVQEYKSNPNKG